MEISQELPYLEEHSRRTIGNLEGPRMSIIIVRTGDDFEPYFKCSLCGQRFLAHATELGFESHLLGVDEFPGTVVCQACRKGGVSQLTARGRMAFWRVPDVLRRLGRPDRQSLLEQIQERRRWDPRG
jgi:hypothetical protein